MSLGYTGRLPSQQTAVPIFREMGGATERVEGNISDRSQDHMQSKPLGQDIEP